MRVFKFGGASVKNGDGVRNLAGIVKQYDEKLIIVVSAMGKTTNALENILKRWFASEYSEAKSAIDQLKEEHLKITHDLFGNDSVKIDEQLSVEFNILYHKIKTVPSLNFDFEYDQLVSMGEIISTRIVAAYLNYSSQKCEWIDVRQLLKSDDRWRDATIDWDYTTQLMRSAFTFQETGIYLTQGFIGSTNFNSTTTLGREGSDYSAAIIANVMDAADVTIWKDVPGIMNADPNLFPDTTKLDLLSYREAVEMTYYGAKVIHPKTMKPLVEKGIPLYVKSFLQPEDSGSMICKIDHEMTYVPVMIVKEDQVLISISPLDFSFIAEENIAGIYNIVSKFRIRINLVQQSAMHLSIAIDYPERNFDQLIRELSRHFLVQYNLGLELLTIRYFTPEAVEKTTKGRSIYLEQKTRKTVRFLLK